MRTLFATGMLTACALTAGLLLVSFIPGGATWELVGFRLHEDHGLPDTCKLIVRNGAAAFSWAGPGELDQPAGAGAADEDSQGPTEADTAATGIALQPSHRLTHRLVTKSNISILPWAVMELTFSWWYVLVAAWLYPVLRFVRHRRTSTPSQRRRCMRDGLVAASVAVLSIVVAVTVAGFSPAHFTSYLILGDAASAFRVVSTAPVVFYLNAEDGAASLSYHGTSHTPPPTTFPPPKYTRQSFLPNYFPPEPPAHTISIRHDRLAFTNVMEPSIKVGSWQAVELTFSWWYAFLVSLTVTTSLVVWRWRTTPAPGHCACGYNLVGNTSGVCPECGNATPSSA